MIFAEWAIDEAEGTILAYTLVTKAESVRKGTLLTKNHIEALKRAGINRVVAARLEPNDIGEDEAALVIGQSLIEDMIEAGPATTGRVNLFARSNGLFSVDVAGIDTINLLDPRISVATLNNLSRVESGQMVATVKIIPFAVPGSLIGNIRTVLETKQVLKVHSFEKTRLGVIQSRLPSVRETVLDKTHELITKRVQHNCGSVIAETRVAHEIAPLSKAISELSTSCDLLIIFSASAVADEIDIVPRSIVQAGGEILRIGIPVDPGNLLSLGKLNGKYIIVAPGTARSARENSLDQVLDRLMAGLALDSDALARMGVGGLLL